MKHAPTLGAANDGPLCIFVAARRTFLNVGLAIQLHRVLHSFVTEALHNRTDQRGRQYTFPRNDEYQNRELHVVAGVHNVGHDEPKGRLDGFK